MTDKDVRQLVRIRYELRRLSSEGDQAAAAKLLARMRALTAPHPTERPAIESEMLRWQVAFNLEGDWGDLQASPA